MLKLAARPWRRGEIDSGTFFIRFSDDTETVLEMLDVLPFRESLHNSLLARLSKTIPTTHKG